MRIRKLWIALPVALAALAWPSAPVFSQATDSLAALKQAFIQPPDDARIMMRWWWFGSAVEKPELEREMRAMKDGGIGGFEVQPVYPVTLDDPANGLVNHPYLSKEFLDALTFTGKKAKELGLRMDLTLCSGWPYGGPHIPITQAASRLRVDRVAVPAKSTEVTYPRIAEGEKLFAVFIGSGTNYTAVSKVDANRISVPAAASDRTALLFISSRTRMKVKRPAVGAEGLVLDHYDRSAIDKHLQLVGEKLLGALQQTPPYAVFSDSLEVERSDWTPNFLDEFRKRRGYDLTPYLPALAVDIGSKTADIRHDWGQTLTELANENYLTPIREWAHAHHTLFRSQTYGTPPVTLSSNALVDLPEGESSYWRHATATRWASSASHLYDRPVTSSETWTWLHSPVFRATPLDMKAEADLHFLEGINQLIGHGWPYSPPQAGEPGWRFYAAAVFNNHNPWYMVMPDIALYLQRVSFLLRQGAPINDVAIYIPTDDIYSNFTLGNDSVNRALDARLGTEITGQILDAGYNFDLIDDAAIAQKGVPYKILVMPAPQRVPEATRKKLEEYKRFGGIVIDTRDTPALGAALKAVVPDLAHAPEIGFVHRHLPYAEIYFIANTSNHAVKSEARFRTGELKPAWWNPIDGHINGIAATNQFTLDLAPYESRVVVFTKQAESSLEPTPAPPIAINSWKVTFENGVEQQMDALRSWTDDDRTKFYSGQASYEATVNIPASLLRASAYLNLGDGAPVTTVEKPSGNGMRALYESPVREAAKVFVNDKYAGAIWSAPFEVNIAGLIHAGNNKVRIVVANLALNEMAKGPLPDYKALNAKYGERFQPQDMQDVQAVPAGLLGPVRIYGKGWPLQ
ncbi:MAG TPA: glycosyl hydrolase [Bryobacteraceae bacterium]|nr:glycosyl hydrolase [Bryobacteraceae bacterium]